jgi:hypothetical protein
MTERTALLGGKLAVWSEVDGGTELELRLPANIVCVTFAKRSWWSRLLTKTPARAEGDASRATAVRSSRGRIFVWN